MKSHWEFPGLSYLVKYIFILIQGFLFLEIPLIMIELPYIHESYIYFRTPKIATYF